MKDKKRFGRFLGTNLKIILGAYLLVVLLVYWDQRNMMYYPEFIENHLASDYGFDMETIRTRTSDGAVLRHWFRPPADEGAAEAVLPLIVFFHGNGGHVGRYGAVLSSVLDAGYGLLAVEYRGYGENPGLISEEALYADADSVMDWLSAQGYEGRDIFIMGLSLGSGIATEMARRYAVGGLILVAPFSSALSVAQSHYWYLPVSLLMKDRYENDRKIAEIETPLLILHGTADGVIPITQGSRLFELAVMPKYFHEIPDAGHNDIFQHDGFAVIDHFIRKYHAPLADDI